MLLDCTGWRHHRSDLDVGAEGAGIGLKIECQEKMNHQGEGGEGEKDILIA